MIEVRKLQSVEGLAALKKDFLGQATAPLDGMWLLGFVPMAQHYGFYQAGGLVGYCCVNAEGYLLQFHLPEPHAEMATALFARILAGKEAPGSLAGAFASTAEPQYLSHCADHFTRIQVNALMYQLSGQARREPDNTEHSLRICESEHLADVVAMACNTLGAPKEWLGGYFEGLLERGELYGLWEEGQLIATGESRGREALGAQYNDVGLIVARSAQGRGLGTDVLRQLVRINDGQGLGSICSTEQSNIAAQKAIARAGFVASNRILQFSQ